MRRVLFVTYYFPPSGGSGVQRGLKMVKYLSDFGWEPIVLTVDPDHSAYPDLDPAMLADVPAHVRVARTRSRDPYTLYARFVGKKKSEAVGVGFLGADHASFRERVARWIRANLFLPDARVGWVGPALERARSIVAEGGVDAVVTTGPPHSAHLIGQRLSAESGLPWIADLRDAWPDPAYAEMLPSSGWARRRDRRIRDRALRSASLRIAVTEDLAFHMEKDTGVPYRLIRNGFDPEDFSASQELDRSQFLLTHTGNLGPARDPEPLWTALANPDHQDRWPRLQVLLVGNVDPGIQATIERLNLQGRIKRIPYVPHHEAIAWMQRSAALLLPINRVMDSAGIVTGKIYEYLAAGRPVLALGDPAGEASRILADTTSGSILAYEDVDGVVGWLDTHYAAWEQGTAHSGANPASLGPYSRKEQAASLARLLEESISESRPPHPS